MKHRLTIGTLEGIPDPAMAMNGPAECVRPVVLVYEGVFQSLDGEVIVTKKHLEKLAENYNAQISKARLLGNGVAHDKYCAPVQLDHSDNATHTVGRLRSMLHVAMHTLLDGKQVWALFGEVTFIGPENCQKANDGRWTNVSIGADFDAGTFTELTITPFPAAAEASLLSRGRKPVGVTMNKFQKCKARLMKTQKLSEDDAMKHLAKMSDEDMDKLAAEHDDEEKKLAAEEDKDKKDLSQEDKDDEKKLSDGDKADDKKDDKDEDGEKKLSADEEAELSRLAAKAGKKLVDEEKDEDKPNGKPVDPKDDPKDKLEGDDKCEKKLSAEDEEKVKKLAKQLSEKEGGDEGEHLARLSKMESSEIDQAIKEHEAKYHLSEDKDADKNDDDKGEKKLSLSADQRTRLARIKKKMEDGDGTARLALRKANIGARLAQLRSKAKITPAEMSKIDIDDLASKGEETVSTLFNFYENREPVIHTGLLGTQKALDHVQLAKEVKRVNLKKEEEEHVANMPFLKRARLAKAEADKKAGKTPGSTSALSAISGDEADAVQEALAKLSDEGNMEGMKRLSAEVMQNVKRMAAGDQVVATEYGKRITELEGSLTELAKSNRELLELINELTK